MKIIVDEMPEKPEYCLFIEWHTGFKQCRISSCMCRDTKKCNHLIVLPKQYIMGVNLANGIDWNHM